jgi:hypothetical protein
MTFTILALRRFACAALAGMLAATPAWAADRPKLSVPDAEAKDAKDMKPYAELIEHTEVKIEMVPIPGGKFLIRSGWASTKSPGTLMKSGCSTSTFSVAS